MLLVMLGLFLGEKYQTLFYISPFDSCCWTISLFLAHVVLLSGTFGSRTNCETAVVCVCDMGRGKSDSKRPVPSKQWSASELTDGHEKLLAIKQESLSPEEIKKQIAETCHHNTLDDFLFRIMLTYSHMYGHERARGSPTSHTRVPHISQEYEAQLESMKKNLFDAAASVSCPYTSVEWGLQSFRIDH